MTTAVHFSDPPAVFTLFGHSIRWQLLQALRLSDLRVQELVAMLKQPQNLVSYHLKVLRRSGLLHERRSLTDRRSLYYSLDLDQARALYFSAGNELHPALVKQLSNLDDTVDPKITPRVLFLCTHNSARSQMAEGILRWRSNARVEVYSAGTEPTEVQPMAIAALKDLDIDISKQRSKSLQEFLGQKFDFIITVCDRAREACPIFPGDPVQIHWSLPDPVDFQGSEKDRMAAYQNIAMQLNARIGYLMLILERRIRGENV